MTSKLRTATKQIAKARARSCGSAPRFHYDFETAPLPTGSRNISMRSDRLSVFLHTTTLKRQLVTLDHEATFVETKHVQFQTTRQIRHLHGFGERRGALIPHLVIFERKRCFKVVFALQCFTAATTQCAAHKRLYTCCHTTLHQRWSNLYPQKMPCEDARIVCATASPVCVHQNMSSQTSSHIAAFYVC